MAASQARFAVKEFLRACFAGLPSKIHWIFLLTATPLVIFLAVWTPPFQSADEPGHFYRAYQVAQGEILGNGGGYADSAIPQLYACVAALPFNDKARFTAADRAKSEEVTWTGHLIYLPFPNTAVYAPTGYLPQALGVAFGKGTGMGVMRTLVLARLLNGTFAILVCTLALYWCRRGKVVMFAVLLMPMTLSLFASCNQDTTLIALTCLAFAIISRQIATGVPLSFAQATALALSLLIVCLGRPPYVPLLLVLLIPHLLPSWQSKPSWLPGALLAASIVAATVAWWRVASASTRGLVPPSSAYGPVDAKLQLLNLFHHPGMVAVLAAYIFSHAAVYLAGMIGVLGWLDTPMPPTYYLAITLVLLMAGLAELADGGKVKPSATALLLGSPLAALATVFLIEYLTWTWVGAPAIFGVQGRYGIPLAIAAAVGLPALTGSPKIRERVTAIVVLSQILTLVCLPQVIMTRYYLP
ncbi:MAG: DUF2142 domain-containing protein [Terracidiphilus sp.]